MLTGSQWIEHLQRGDMLHAPWAHDRVTVKGSTLAGEPVWFSIIGPCFSEFKSGPNLWILANVAGWMFGPGSYGLESCRLLGYRS